MNICSSYKFSIYILLLFSIFVIDFFLLFLLLGGCWILQIFVIQKLTVISMLRILLLIFIYLLFKFISRLSCCSLLCAKTYYFALKGTHNVPTTKWCKKHSHLSMVRLGKILYYIQEQYKMGNGHKKDTIYFLLLLTTFGFLKWERSQLAYPTKNTTFFFSCVTYIIY